MSKNNKTSNKKIILIIALVILIPVGLITVGLILIVLVGGVATSSRDSAMDACFTDYKNDTERAVEAYKSSSGRYPNSLQIIPDKQFPERSIYDECVETLEYSSDGTTYTIIKIEF